MDVGINLTNSGPYRIKIKVKEHKPFLWLAQFPNDRKSNVRFGPARMSSKKYDLHFNKDEVAHVFKCLVSEKDWFNIIEIVIVKDY